MRLKLAAISESEWNNFQYKSLREQINISQRKIEKRVDLGIERERFINACHTIQQIGFQDSNKIILVEKNLDFDLNILKVPFLEIGSQSFLDNLFDPHEDIGGFITSIDIFYGDLEFEKKTMKNENKSFPESLKLLDNIKYNNNDLTKKIKFALTTGEPIGKSNKLDRHANLIKCLRDFVYFEGSELENIPFIRFAYDDGSVGGEFQLFYLKKIIKPIPTEIINIGLISNRHDDEYDQIVDYYLIRNAEISKGEEIFISEQEQIAYDKGIGFINSILKNSKEESIYQINLYHTGLEAAVIGAYRAIIDKLSNNRGRIIIKPFIEKNHSLEDWY